VQKPAKIIKGNLIYTHTPDRFIIREHACITVENGIIRKITDSLPDDCPLDIVDYGNCFIIPGFTDMHLHASQIGIRGIGSTKELIPWLVEYTYPEEERYADKNYSRLRYSFLVKELVRQGTLRAVIWGTIHTEAAVELFTIAREAGIRAYIGKVAMDQNSPPGLTEPTDDVIRQTESFVRRTSGISDRVKPIILPRFVPACSPALLGALGDIAARYKVPVQSHLNENRAEIDWVRSMYPRISSYARVYDSFGLFGTVPTSMAHCIHNTEEESILMKERGVTAIHCPDSNPNLSSGIMPLRSYLDKGISVVLGSDISAGHTLSMQEVMVRAIQLSKLIRQQHHEQAYLSLSEAFYLATAAGSELFPGTGALGEGNLFDALVIDDASLGCTDIALEDRLARYIYTGDDRNIHARYVSGREL
jgi:guanine deaminase